MHDVKEKFNRQEVQDEQFFREWQDDLPEPTDAEKHWLDEIKAERQHIAHPVCSSKLFVGAGLGD